MFWTSILRAATASAAPENLGQSIQRLLPTKLPPSLASHPGNLYRILSRTPSGGVGKRVYQLRWSEKNLDECYWVVTKAVFKDEGKHGRAWGNLYWRGKLVQERPMRIRGALKYTWAEGHSQASLPTATA
ncbi:hypothetical protein BT96DRAFT_852172, partial [Gymnopus androsaceus JB14]